MNSQAMGDLASDQKIDKLFHAYGYSIPVAKDGRRLWPTKFKREMGQRMRSGTLSVSEIQKACCVSESTAYKWKKKHARGASTAPRNAASGPASNFAEVKVDRDSTKSEAPASHVIFRRNGCELLLPSDYPIDRLVNLISAFETET